MTSLAKSGGPRVSLRSAVKTAFTEMIASTKANNMLVLLLDPRTTGIISSGMKMYDILEHGIALVENLHLRRQPLPEMQALYFVEPTEDNVKRIVEDFTKTKERSKMYSCAHIFFSRPLPSDPSKLLNLIKACANLRVNIKNFAEQNIDFLTVEENLASFNFPNAFHTFFANLNESQPERFQFLREQKALKDQIVDCLITLCYSLHENPEVRYYKRPMVATEQVALPHRIAKDFAEKYKAKLDSEKDKFWYHGQENLGGGSTSSYNKVGKERATLLVLDRTKDNLAPLIHELSYQCLVYDLLNVDRQRYSYETEVDDERAAKGNPTGGATAAAATSSARKTIVKTVLLNEDDSVYGEIRHKHYIDFLDSLHRKVKAWSKGKTGSLESVEEMKKAMMNFSERQELKSKLYLHVSVAQKIKSYDESPASDTENTFPSLRNLTALEQSILDGKEYDGSKVTNLEKKIVHFVKQMDEEYENSKLAFPEEEYQKLITKKSDPKQQLNAYEKRRLVGLDQQALDRDSWRYNKLRLIALYLLKHNIRQSQLKAFVSECNLSPREIIKINNNLKIMKDAALKSSRGVEKMIRSGWSSLFASSSTSGGQSSETATALASGIDHRLSRYQPALKSILTDLIK
eukprot:g3594.t1